MADEINGGPVQLNRFAHHRFIGVRTLGLVSLGAAALVVAALETGSGSDQLAAASRIIQGIVTGIGFIGTGVIVQGESPSLKSRNGSEKSINALRSGVIAVLATMMSILFEVNAGINSGKWTDVN